MPSFKHLKQGPRVLDKILKDNEFRHFFRKLSSVIATGQAEDEDDEDDEIDEQDDVEGDDDGDNKDEGDKEGEVSDDDSDNEPQTGSSRENQQEIHSESALQDVVETVLRHADRDVSAKRDMEV